MRDYANWAALRHLSREFLTPWEPTWPSDDLTRASFRRRLRRHANEIENDEAYPFLVFREGDDALLGGLTFGQVKRGVTDKPASRVFDILGRNVEIRILRQIDSPSIQWPLITTTGRGVELGKKGMVLQCPYC